MNDDNATNDRLSIPNVEIMDTAPLSTVDTLRAVGLPVTHMDGDAAIAHIERLEKETGGSGAVKA